MISTEWILGITGGFITLNTFIVKLLSNKKENKLIKSVKTDITEKFIPYEEKLRNHDNRLSCIEKDIIDIKIFIGKTEMNVQYIKETLDELKEISSQIFAITNRTREQFPYAKIENVNK